VPDGLVAVAGGERPAERELIGRLPEVLAACRRLEPGDRARGAAVLRTLTGAMVEVLERFPAEGDARVGALETRADLDRYIYGNAGCVGEYWTDMVLAHRPRCAQRWDPAAMRARGVRFGQGLQLVNVLRDLPRDLRIGRCYLPRVELAGLGLAPVDLLDSRALPQVRPLLDALLAEARARLDDGLAYTLAVPRVEWRLRLACAWPLLIGLATLGRLARADALLDPAVVVKVSRAEVRGILGRSAVVVGSDRGLRGCAQRLATSPRDES
jgi:farnesyl-diphosphate farnesyltransferase